MNYKLQWYPKLHLFVKSLDTHHKMETTHDYKPLKSSKNRT